MIARETLKLYFEPDRGVFPKQGELDLKGLGRARKLRLGFYPVKKAAS